MNNIMRFTKRYMVISSLLIVIILSSFIAVDAGCTGWSYKIKGTKCTIPHCGPGGVLWTKYEFGTKMQVCKVNGKLKTISLPYSSIVRGCCK